MKPYPFTVSFAVGVKDFLSQSSSVHVVASRRHTYKCHSDRTYTGTYIEDTLRSYSYRIVAS